MYCTPNVGSDVMVPVVGVGGGVAVTTFSHVVTNVVYVSAAEGADAGEIAAGDGGDQLVGSGDQGGNIERDGGTPEDDNEEDGDGIADKNDGDQADDPEGEGERAGDVGVDCISGSTPPVATEEEDSSALPCAMATRVPKRRAGTETNCMLVNRRKEGGRRNEKGGRVLFPGGRRGQRSAIDIWGGWVVFTRSRSRAQRFAEITRSYLDSNGGVCLIYT
jgi:hypothetical protein